MTHKESLTQAKLMEDVLKGIHYMYISVAVVMQKNDNVEKDTLLRELA